MLRKLSLALIVVLCSFSNNAQELDSTKLKQIEFYKNIIYQTNSFFFKKETLYSKLDKTFIPPWKELILQKGQLIENLDSLAKYASIKLSIDAFMGNGLKLESRFPQSLKDDLIEIFDIKIIDSNLFDKNNIQIEIKDSGSINFGSVSSSGFKDGKSYSNQWKTLSSTFNFKNKNLDTLTGSVKFKASLIHSYDYKKITPQDIGKLLQIQNLDFKVIDVFDNKLVLHFIDKKDNLVSNLKFFNLNKNNFKIGQIPYFEFAKLKEKDTSIQTDHKGEGTTNIFAFNYKLFKKEPTISLEDFKAKTNDKFTKIIVSKNKEEEMNKQFGDRYIIIYTADNIENLYLYLPNKIEKEFEIEIN